MQSISPPHAKLVATFIMHRKPPHEAYKYPTPQLSIVHKPHILHSFCRKKQCPESEAEAEAEAEAATMSALPRSIASPIPVRAKARPTHTPVVDLCRLNQSSTQRSLVLKDIARECRKHGYFQVVNHGVSHSVMKGALEAASDFFALSKEAKGQFASDDIRRPVRYEMGTKDGKARSFLKHYAHPLGDWVHLWPAEPPSYREKMGMYAIEARKLALQLMDAILESLGLGQAYLRKELEEGMQMLAVNGYPQFSQADVMVGLFPHSDFGFITILHQSCHGLEVMDHDDKSWRAVPHQPGALHVHIGDHLEVLSNGEFKTLVHRAVLNPDNTRISIASIHGLAIDEKVSTAKELLDGQQPIRYKDSSFRDYLDYLRWKIKNQRSFIDSLKIGRA